MAKVRINVRFAPELWAGIQAAVKAGRARDATDALESAAAQWLGVARDGEEPVAKPVNGRSARRKAAQGVRPAAPARGASRTVKAGIRPIPKGGGKTKGGAK